MRRPTDLEKISSVVDWLIEKGIPGEEYRNLTSEDYVQIAKAITEGGDAKELVHEAYERSLEDAPF